ncbi:MAG: DUF4365 domain-containing protein [Nitrosopumilus sp.]|nr:DUF4365 domain-containing protein [Nitrosopumilus sp.]
MNSKSHKTLPKSDRNERLERLSSQALEAVLPVEKFLPREDKPDKGVDSSIEVIDDNEDFTNFRAQIQLKGTYEQEINKDGSVSFSIETSNIRYLWNNLTSIYVLYIEPRKELRFVWLKDEIKRLNEENPDWQNQGEVTLRFIQILNVETTNQIHAQITKEGLLQRKIKETLTTNPESSSRFEVNSLNLVVTNQNDAKKILNFYGLELLNTGYENFVLEKYDLLDNSEKKRAKFLLLKSRAEGKLGKYRAALDTLGTIDSMNCELSPTEKFHFESIENHSNWLLGQIDTEQFLGKLQELSTNDLVKDSILDNFNFLHFSLMYGRENGANTSELFGKIAQLKKIGQEILSDDNFSQEMKVNIEFSILENELKWLILEQTSLKGESAIYEATSTYIPEHWDRKENFPIELKKWVDKSSELINRAQNITTKADISSLQVNLWFHQNQSSQFWAANTGKEHFVDKEASDYFIEKLQTIINIYIEYQQSYSIIRAKMLMVEILSLVGKSEESETLRKQINNQANRMSYDALKNLTEFSLHKSLFDYAQNAMSQLNK